MRRRFCKNALCFFRVGFGVATGIAIKHNVDGVAVQSVSQAIAVFFAEEPDGAQEREQRLREKSTIVLSFSLRSIGQRDENREAS